MNHPNPTGVQVRLIGTPGQVAAVLCLLEQGEITHGPQEYPARTPGHVRTYLTVIRRYPATGGHR